MGTAMTTALQALPAVSSLRSRAEGSDPFVFHGRRLRAGWALEDTSLFSDDVWNLGQAMLKKHERRFILDFSLIPVIHRQVARNSVTRCSPGPSRRARNDLRSAPSAPPSPTTSGSCAGQPAAPRAWTP